jgi:hypothetical protein
MNERGPRDTSAYSPAVQKQMRWAFDGYETVLANDRESAVTQVGRYDPAEGLQLLPYFDCSRAAIMTRSATLRANPR